MSSARKIRFRVPASESGKRLDQILAANVPGLSRRRARLLLDIGGVFVDGARTKAAGKLLRAGQEVEAVMGGALDRATPKLGKEARESDESGLPPYKVVHEDEDLVVVDKPAGLLTAPTPESDRNNLAYLLAHRGGKKPTREEPGIFVVHRIDMETSGLLVFAKTADANRELSELFRVHDVEREYLAIVDGVWPEHIRTVRHPIDGRHAITHLAIEKKLAKATILRVRLETGRTHQIRIHCRVKRHPVLGDTKHGLDEPAGDRLPSLAGTLRGAERPALPAHCDRPPPRMALHATKLGFEHPRTKKKVSFESPLPDDLAGWLATLR